MGRTLSIVMVGVATAGVLVTSESAAHADVDDFVNASLNQASATVTYADNVAGSSVDTAQATISYAGNVFACTSAPPVTCTLTATSAYSSQVIAEAIQVVAATSVYLSHTQGYAFATRDFAIRLCSNACG